MKWLRNLFVADPEKMTPFGRQVLAEMNVHPEDFGLSPTVLYHSTLGTFTRGLFRRLQREKVAGHNRDRIATDTPYNRKDYRRLNRHDRIAITARHSVMLGLEVPVPEVRTGTERKVSVSGIQQALTGVPNTAIAVQQVQQQALEEHRRRMYEIQRELGMPPELLKQVAEQLGLPQK